jgi:hypothetical protein
MNKRAIDVGTQDSSDHPLITTCMDPGYQNIHKSANWITGRDERSMIESQIPLQLQ